jgi:protein-L-isoaspartate(D-aspartate) O-methyltransferase
VDYFDLLKRLIKKDYLKTPLIIEAFKNINRADFLPENLRGQAGVDAPMPIGFGQTISQPLTVAFMLELLRPEPGDKILDVGAGSGWTSALLARCVAQPFVIPSGGPANAGPKRGISPEWAEESHTRERSFGLRPQDDNRVWP